MNRVRFGLVVTMMFGAMYAACGLLESLGQFALGLIVAMTALIAHGLLDFVEAHRDEQLHRERVEVWARRDGAQ